MKIKLKKLNNIFENWVLVHYTTLNQFIHFYIYPVMDKILCSFLKNYFDISIIDYFPSLSTGRWYEEQSPVETCSSAMHVPLGVIKPTSIENWKRVILPMSSQLPKVEFKFGDSARKSCNQIVRFRLSINQWGEVCWFGGHSFIFWYTLPFLKKLHNQVYSKAKILFQRN